jgi:outer membrane protein assembly factor BamB
MSRSPCLFLPSILLLAALSARADWPLFRGGPDLHGVAPGSFPEKPALLWTFDAGAPVKSSAVIRDGLVVVGAENGVVHALTLADGKPRWSYATSNVVESAALILGDAVYVTDNGGTLHALGLADGQPRWRYVTEGELPGGCNSFEQDGRLNLLVGSYDYRLHCVDAATGRSNWVYETENYINGVPAIENGVTCFGGCDAKAHVVSLKDGTKLRSVELGAYIAGSAALRDGRLYVGNYGNRFQCVDVNEGKLVWEYAWRDFAFYAAPALLGDRVVVGGRDKHLHCLDARDGRLLWRYRAGHRIDSSPLICDGKILFGCDDGRVYMVALEDGRELWTHDLGKAITASPAISGGRLVIGSTDGRVACFGTPSP